MQNMLSFPMQGYLGYVGLRWNFRERSVFLLSFVVHRINKNKTLISVCYLWRHRLCGGNKEIAEIRKLITAPNRACSDSAGRKWKQSCNSFIRLRYFITRFHSYCYTCTCCMQYISIFSCPFIHRKRTLSG